MKEQNFNIKVEVESNDENIRFELVAVVTDYLNMLRDSQMCYDFVVNSEVPKKNIESVI